MKKPDILLAIKPVAEAFEKLDIPYCIGGSVASSTYGIPRSTMDIDMVSDLKKQHVVSFVKMLEQSFYIDKDMVLDAIQRRSSFNIIHLETMLKIDIFISKNLPHDIEAFRRRKKDTLDEDQKTAEFFILSPEDIMLNKLDWFRLGGGISERQWHDVLGILKIQRNALDQNYLKHWAKELKLEELLEKAIEDSGININ